MPKITKRFRTKFLALKMRFCTKKGVRKMLMKLSSDFPELKKYEETKSSNFKVIYQKGENCRLTSSQNPTR